MWSDIMHTLPAAYVLRPDSLPAAEISAELQQNNFATDWYFDA